MIWVSVTISFFALRVVPYDAITAQLMEVGVSSEVIEVRRSALGLDLPLVLQYLHYLGGLVQGDLGVSLLNGLPVAELIVFNVYPTLELALSSLLIGCVLGVPLGMWGIAKRWDGVVGDRRLNVWLPYALPLRNFVIALILSVPGYWLGTILIWVFALELDWLPASGAGGLERLLLPAIVLGIGVAGGVATMSVVLVGDVLRQEYVRVAYGKGLSARSVTSKHVLRMILPGVVAHLNTQAVFLLGGTVITESVFSRSGLGRLLLDAAVRQDFPVVQGVVVWSSCMVLLANVVTTVMQTILDPRIRS